MKTLNKRTLEHMIAFNEALAQVQEHDYAVSEYYRGVTDAYKAILKLMEND